jgi:hypothetical protein
MTLDHISKDSIDDEERGFCLSSVSVVLFMLFCMLLLKRSIVNHLQAMTKKRAQNPGYEMLIFESKLL